MLYSNAENQVQNVAKHTSPLTAPSSVTKLVHNYIDIWL